MVTYEYKCKYCTKRTYSKYNMGEAPDEIRCGCGQYSKRIFTNPNVIYRSGGFNTTDKRLDKTEYEQYI